jgi:hypothetical protein
MEKLHVSQNMIKALMMFGHTQMHTTDTISFEPESATKNL